MSTIPLIFLERTLDPRLALLLNALVWLVFTAEFLHVLSVCGSRTERRAWILYSRIDILIIVGSFPILPSSLQSIRLLRIGRASRIVRFLRLGRVFAIPWVLRWMGKRFQLHPIAFSTSSMLIAVVLAANALHILEPELVPSLGHAMWWAFTTCSTVGYGDIVPATPSGRAVGIFLMVVGVAATAAFSGSLASYLVQHSRDVEDSDTAKILEELRVIRSRLEEMESRDR